MANIGTFTKTEQGFTGELVTLSLKAKNVRLVEEAASSNENAPTHRVFVGRVEIGAAWAKRSNEGRPYLSVKLDDPSFTNPIYANLIEDESSKTHALIWSRPNGRRSGDWPAQDAPSGWSGRGISRLANCDCAPDEIVTNALLSSQSHL
jgi:uncharacterized protein (DUF736 family)